MIQKFGFELLGQNGQARRGKITTPHGVIDTPAFMPVGTQGTVKAMFLDDVKQTGAQIILGNVYHLMLRPTAELIARQGGLHQFIGWDGAILTDSGGFQVMSLSSLREMSEEGVTFRSHIDGSKHMLSPERAMEIQSLLGSDIQMQLDECVRLPADETRINEAMQLSLRWAERSKMAFENYGGNDKGQAIYGIVQGGDLPHLRVQSAKALSDMAFHGYSIGGLAVGEPQHVMLATLEETLPHLPENKPRYLMGVGTPDDLLESVKRGVDQFDCVMPTRAGRHGLIYSRFGKINIKNARHKEDPRPVDETSNCPAARDYSRSYLHHLVRANEALGGMLLTWINIAYYQDLMHGMRKAIECGEFDDFYARTKEGWAQGDIAAI